VTAYVISEEIVRPAKAGYATLAATYEAENVAAAADRKAGAALTEGRS
jgi:hypothetical protein